MNLEEKVQSLLTAANAATGESDTNLTDAIATLIAGQGGGETFASPNKIIHEIVTLETDYDGNIVELSDILRSLTSYPSMTFRGFAAAKKSNPVKYEWYLYNNYNYNFYFLFMGIPSSCKGWRFNGTTWAETQASTAYSAKAFAGDKFDVYVEADFVPPEEV